MALEPRDVGPGPLRTPSSFNLTQRALPRISAPAASPGVMDSPLRGCLTSGVDESNTDECVQISTTNSAPLTNVFTNVEQ